MTHTLNAAFIDPLSPITGTVRFSILFVHQITQTAHPILSVNTGHSLKRHNQAPVETSKFGVNTLTSRRGRQQIPIEKTRYLHRASTPAVSFLAAYPTPAN